MIIEDKKTGSFIYSSFGSLEEADLYYSLKEYLIKAGIWQSVSIQSLHRYCKLQFAFIKLIEEKPKNYVLEKYAKLLNELEESLCLTPASMLKYKKDQILIAAKKEKVRKSISEG